MTISPERPDTANSIAPLRVRVRDERGIALVIAMMAVILLTGLGIALVLLTNTETMITANYRNSQETLYAADAAVETVVQDLLLEADWNQLLAGQVHSGFFDPSATVTLGDGSTVNVNALLTDLQHETDALNFWGLNDATWQWYARGRLATLSPSVDPRSNVYVAVFVGDDPSEQDGNPLLDSNGVVTLHVEAFGPGGARKSVEVTVSRTNNVEIERGYIAQRGQEELNQRARKAAVQNPGRSLTETRMSVSSGNSTIMP